MAWHGLNGRRPSATQYPNLAAGEKLVNISFFAARHTLAQASFTAVGEGGGREVNSMRGRTYPGPHPSRRGGSPQLRVGASYRDVSQAISLGIIWYAFCAAFVICFRRSGLSMRRGQKPERMGEKPHRVGLPCWGNSGYLLLLPRDPPKKKW